MELSVPKSSLERVVILGGGFAGIKTTIPFHQKLMENEDFNKGNFTTKFMETFEY